MNYHEHQYHSHDGLALHYREYGNGEQVIICLPGLTRNCRDYEGLASHLSRRWRVITPDLRGRGKSQPDPNWKQYLPPTYARDMWTLLDHLGIDQVSIVGTSLGGLMAMIMADQQPQRLRAVVMNDVGPHVPPEAIARLLQYVGRTPPQPDWESAVAMTRKNYGLAYPDADNAFWEQQVRNAWSQRDDGSVAPDHDPKIGDALRHASKAAGRVRFLQKIGIRRLRGINFDPWDNFKAMSMPTLLLRGELSDILLPETVAQMQAMKPDLEVVTIPGRGHTPTLDEPESRAAIDRFLAEHA